MVLIPRCRGGHHDTHGLVSNDDQALCEDWLAKYLSEACRFLAHEIGVNEMSQSTRMRQRTAIEYFETRWSASPHQLVRFDLFWKISRMIIGLLHCEVTGLM